MLERSCFCELGLRVEATSLNCEFETGAGIFCHATHRNKLRTHLPRLQYELTKSNAFFFLDPEGDVDPPPTLGLRMAKVAARTRPDDIVATSVATTPAMIRRGALRWARPRNTCSTRYFSGLETVQMSTSPSFTSVDTHFSQQNLEQGAVSKSLKAVLHKHSLNLINGVIKHPWCCTLCFNEL